jgi:MFS family permease
MGIWPLWIERLGAPITIVGLVLGSSGIVRLAVLAPSAALAERFGVRRLILLARVVAGLGMVSAALATHWTHLFIMVVGSAIGELAFPLTLAHVAAHAGKERVRAFALVFGLGPSVALGLGPLLSGALVAVWGMRAAFILAASCTLLSIIFFARIKVAAVTTDEHQTAPKMSYRDALADGPVRRVLMLQGATIFALAMGTTLVPTFLADERGLAPARIATLGALAAVGSTVFGLIVTRTPRLQRSPFIGAALAVGLTLGGLQLFVRSSEMVLIGLAFVCRGGFLSAWSLFAGALGEVAPARHRARAFALSEMLAGAAFSFAPMVAGQLYALRPTLPFLAATLLSLSIVPLLFRAQRVAHRLAPRRESAEPEVVLEPEVI